MRFALEVHPSEIAYDYWTAKATLDAIGHRKSFGINFDPSHFMWQQLDSVAFVLDFADHIFHVHVQGVDHQPRRSQRRARLAPAVGESAPRVDVRLDRSRRRCRGSRCSARSTRSATTARPASSGRTPAWTASSAAPEALAFVRKLNAITPPAAAFDAAFSTKAGDA